MVTMQQLASQSLPADIQNNYYLHHEYAQMLMVSMQYLLLWWFFILYLKLLSCCQGYRTKNDKWEIEMYSKTPVVQSLHKLFRPL